MHPFENWYHRHLADNDPAPEPASPPPFVETDRVVVSVPADHAEDLDGQILNGQHGTVVEVRFTSDPDDVYGPWVIKVLIDRDSEPMMFHADELRRETTDPSAAEPVVVSVKQPEDDPDQPVPYVPASLEPWIQRAKELRHEAVFTDTPVYDDVVAEALSADGLAAEVEAWLAAQTDGAA